MGRELLIDTIRRVVWHTMLLEESRAEHHRRIRRRSDRRWLRHVVTTLINPDDSPIDDVLDADRNRVRSGCSST